MSIDEVLKVLKDSYGVVVHYQTVRNWQNPKKGHRGVFLAKDPSEAQVNAFIALTGTEFKRGRPRSKIVTQATPDGTVLYKDGIASIWKVGEQYLLRMNGADDRLFTSVADAMLAAGVGPAEVRNDPY